MSVMLELCDTCILEILGRILVNFAIAEVSELLSVERLCYCCHFYKDLSLASVSPREVVCAMFVPVSHCKDTHNFDKTNNFFKKVKKKGDQVSGLLCIKLTELLYYYKQVLPTVHKGGQHGCGCPR